MINQKNTAILIPARLAATRLPNKPLELIDNQPMIIHVWKRAIESSLGKVVVATDSVEIAKLIKDEGGISVITEQDHQSGSDRIYEALQKIDYQNIDLIMNLQGDEPLMNIEDIKNLHTQMIKTKSELGTMASNILDKNLYEKLVFKSGDSLDMSVFCVKRAL